MTYWKAKLLPTIKKYFGKGSKKAAAEAAKSFNKSKETIENEIQEKKGELEPKVIEIYKDSKPETKMLMKEPSEEKIKKQGDVVLDLLQRLVEIGCPGAQALKEAGDKYGAASMSAQIEYLLQKISAFVVNEEAPAPASASGATPVVAEANGTAKEISVEKIVEEEKEKEKEAAPEAVAESKEKVVIVEEKEKETATAEKETATASAS